MNLAIDNLIATQPYLSYPYMPSSALTGNFVNSQNDSMLIILGFSSETDQNTIAQVESDVQNSGLQNFGAVYVTGGSVLSKDVEKAFLPALEVTAGPGIAISLLIVGLLFMAPVSCFDSSYFRRHFSFSVSCCHLHFSSRGWSFKLDFSNTNLNHSAHVGVSSRLRGSAA